MNCTVCMRPLFEGASACIICGAPAPRPMTPHGAQPAAQHMPAPMPAPMPMPMPTHDAYAPAPPQAMPMPPPMPMAAYAQQQQAHYYPQQHPSPQQPHPYSQQHHQPQPPMYGAPYATAQNQVAVVSLVCGLLGLVPFWIGFLLCIIAIICGVIGIQNADRTPGHRGRAMAIAGLVLGLIFIIPAGCGL